MKKRILSLIAVIQIFLFLLNVQTFAVSDPTITSHKNGYTYDTDDFYIKWKAVSGAKRYRLAVKSLDDGSYAADIYWDDALTKTAYECDEDDIKPGHKYKIWVGACGNGHEDVISQYSIEITAKAECDHDDYDDYYDYTEYEKISGDDVYHTAVHYYERICEDCDETIKTDVKGNMEKENHSFYGNKCSDCKYIKQESFSPTPQQGQGQTNPDSSYEISDATPPSINIASPQYSDTYSSDYYNTIDFVVTASDESGINSIVLYKNGYKYTSSNFSQLSVQIPMNELNSGRNDFQIIATDNYGNTKTENTYINITIPEKPQDTEAPVVYSFDCSSGSTVNRDDVDAITFTAYARDNESVTKMTLSIGTAIDTEYSSSITSTVQTSGLRLGENEFFIIAEDEAGNVGYSDSIYITITEDEDDFYETPQQNQGYTNSDGTWENNTENLHDKAYRKAGYYNGIEVFVNGEKLYFDVQPQSINNRTMVPLRAIFEALGASVEWNESLQQVTASSRNHVVELIIGETTMNVWHLDWSGPSGWTYLDSPAVVIDGRTLVPVRAISEAFMCDVEWYEDKELVSIVSE